MVSSEKIRGTFIKRLNRFVCMVDVDGRIERAYLPNPGRLWELLLPGNEVLLVPNASCSAKSKYILLAVYGLNGWVLLHTHLTNTIIEDLLSEKRIGFLADYDLLEREVKLGNRRIDFLLEGRDEKIYLEVKTCTLFGEKLAMFPDAVTIRGADHITRLAEISKENGKKGMVLFVVMNPGVEYFLPAYHIDRVFTMNMLKYRDLVDFRALAIGFDSDFKRVVSLREIPIPWGYIESLDLNKGVYLLILELDEDKFIDVGSLGKVEFKKGYYVYVGSAMNSLSKRLSRHKSGNKKLRWHIDYLTVHVDRIWDIPIVTDSAIEEEIALRLYNIANGFIEGFGASDSTNNSHLFYFRENPMEDRRFMDLVCYFRLDWNYERIRRKDENSYTF